MRRYREIFIFVPRKNSKTTLAGGIADEVFFLDDEPGSQVYFAAAEREQASLCFRIAAAMIANEKTLRKRCDIYRGRKEIVMKPEFSPIRRNESGEIVESKEPFLKAISADAHTKHGFNVHCAIIDELHAQPNRDLVDVLQTGTVSRKQPLIIHITTSDFDRPSICNEKHDYASKVRDGIIHDPSFLPAIWEASKDDDWTSPATWRKANPNLGRSVSEEYLARECQRAQESPAYENTFKRLHLNIRTEQDVRWMPMDAWDKTDRELPELDGRLCYGGLDLASTSDLTAFVLAFPGDPMWVLPFFWLPKETAKIRDREARVPYLTWERQGFIKTTPGNATDYGTVREDIMAMRKRFNIREIAFDKWNALQISNDLANYGFEMVEFPQTLPCLNEPTKKLERMIRAGEIAFGKNPVLRWMASNVTVHEDNDGRIKPDRKKSSEKIDGIVATAMAVGRWLSNTQKPSVYQSRGLVTI